MANFEIEIKSLIGDKAKAADLVSKMKKLDPNFASHGSHKQLNHYFVGGDLESLRPKLSAHLSPEKQKEFENLAKLAKDFSVRTRWVRLGSTNSESTESRRADGKVIFVVKATVDDTTSSNGTARQEFESTVDMTLEDLDKTLLDAGFQYQAKWSREREDYKYKGMNVSVDKNAGYGYLAEFEQVIDDSTQADTVKSNIRKIMKELGAEELNQDRLARMFDHYNKNWQDYYGTDNVFNIE
jgi:predicted adenylyl cyclase CyaB